MENLTLTLILQIVAVVAFSFSPFLFEWSREKAQELKTKRVLEPAPSPKALEMADVPDNVVKQIEESAVARLRAEEDERQQEEDERLQQEVDAHNLDYERSMRIHNEQRHILYLKRLGRFQAYEGRNDGLEVVLDHDLSGARVFNNTGIDLIGVTLFVVSENAEHGRNDQCSDFPSLPSGKTARCSSHSGFWDADFLDIAGINADTGQPFYVRVPLDPDLTMYEFREDSGEQYGTCF